jgi:Zn-dependent peptidase ImmA (M78 family)
VVVLNPMKGDYYRQRFDVAHELGHLVMHQDAEPGRRPAEVAANRFAAELLMPREAIAGELPRRLHWPTLQALKEHWGVSLQALLLRARELGALSDTTYRNAVTRMTREGWRRREPGVLPEVEQPSLLPGSLRLLAENGLPATALAAQARAPIGIFHTVTARRPAGLSEPGSPAPVPGL